MLPRKLNYANCCGSTKLTAHCYGQSSSHKSSAFAAHGEGQQSALQSVGRRVFTPTGSSDPAPKNGGALLSVKTILMKSRC